MWYDHLHRLTGSKDVKLLTTDVADNVRGSRSHLVES